MGEFHPTCLRFFVWSNDRGQHRGPFRTSPAWTEPDVSVQGSHLRPADTQTGCRQDRRRVLSSRSHNQWAAGLAQEQGEP